MMNIFDVNRRLKQRPPFQMIERVTALEPGESAVGTKTVSINDPWFSGHFPGAPILPGVLIIESCAQLCSIAADDGSGDPDRLYVLLKADNFKFLKFVLPGDVMTISVKKKSGGALVTFDAVVTVDGEIRSKGTLSFTSVAKNTLYTEETEANPS